MMIQTVQAGQF